MARQGQRKSAPKAETPAIQIKLLKKNLSMMEARINSSRTAYEKLLLNPQSTPDYLAACTTFEANLSNWEGLRDGIQNQLKDTLDRQASQSSSQTAATPATASTNKEAAQLRSQPTKPVNTDDD